MISSAESIHRLLADTGVQTLELQRVVVTVLLGRKRFGRVVSIVAIRSVAGEVDKKESAKEKLNEKKGGGEKMLKMDKTADLPKADGLKPQPEVTEPEKVASRSVPDESVSRTSQAASVNKGKRKRRDC
ncbi:hypothetical protein Bca52824_019661 [Brassica carinata]|uniref:Uncharacterized protein n=1 Tax=Brassica carinata TaxID=52824 RepID=A0A8X8AXM2_BRACI|nr:hypothetical protein Bca52824_019661 [Brassica carinata]